MEKAMQEIISEELEKHTTILRKLVDKLNLIEARRKELALEIMREQGAINALGEINKVLGNDRPTDDT